MRYRVSNCVATFAMFVNRDDAEAYATRMALRVPGFTWFVHEVEEKVTALRAINSRNSDEVNRNG